MKMKMSTPANKRKQQETVITLLTVAALVLALLVSQRLWFRLDLTESRGYTISPVTKKLREEIPDQVRITYYLSKNLEAVHPAPGEVRDLLNEYAAYSRGKIRVSVRDPEKAGLSAEVERLGLSPQQIQTVEKSQASVATVYSGIVIEYLDQVEVLPFVFALDTLEYDLTSRIRGMVRGEERQAGFLVADARREWQRDYGTLGAVFSQAGYRLRQLRPGDEIPGDLSFLFVLGGAEDLDDWALYRIDHYIQGGGKVCFAVEGVSVNERLEARALAEDGGQLLKMLSAYGVEVQKNLVLDRSALNITYQTVSPGGSRLYRIARYPLWVGVLPRNGSAGHPVTAGFGGTDLFWGSALALSPPAGVEGEVLFTSTPEAWLETKNFAVNPDMPYLMESEAGATRGQKVLAVALSGVFPSFFTGKEKPRREGSEEELPDLPGEGQAQQTRLIVVGDADMASNLTEYTQSGRNFDFLLKAALWLGNDDDIISIRSRIPPAGRLDRIEDPAARLGAMAFAQILNEALVPLALVVYGVVHALRRRRRLLSNTTTTTGGAS